MIPAWALVLIVIFGLSLLKLSLDGLFPGEHRGGAKKIMGMFKRVNTNTMIGLLSVLIGLWLIIYAIPSLFFNLFHTYLGNLIIIIAVIMAGMRNLSLGVLLAVGLYVVMSMARFRDGLTNPVPEKEKEDKKVPAPIKPAIA